MDGGVGRDSFCDATFTFVRNSANILDHRLMVLSSPERERERERESECLCVCVCEREREREREIG